jgi:hypothetical protein
MLGPAFIIAFIVYFIKASTWRGMILYGIKERLCDLPEFIKKPLFDCPVCMTPWWGTAIYVAGHFGGIVEFEKLSVIRLLFTVFVASGINTIFLIINKFYDKHNPK